ncbi:hypothetical protein MUP37_04085 [Candidatus Bathyarchaeota archaeon]|nr:hypothetical protein [Candidatus Bathyarchaeota archaeon]
MFSIVGLGEKASLVTAGKIFRLMERLEIGTIAAKLKDFRKEDEFTGYDTQITLVTEIRDLVIRANMLHGNYLQDQIAYIYHHGERRPTPRTLEIPFVFVQEKERTLLLVIERKLIANNIANRLSEALFITPGYITAGRISADVLRDFHEKNPDDTKVIFFDNVDIPNINKLSLYGSGLLSTALYNDYLKHGTIWYVVVTASKYESVVGITRNAIVTVFNSIDRDDYIRYVMNEIFPIVET